MVLVNLSLRLCYTFVKHHHIEPIRCFSVGKKAYSNRIFGAVLDGS